MVDGVGGGKGGWEDAEKVLAGRSEGEEMPNEENSEEEEEVEVVIDTPSDGATAFMMENQGKSRDRGGKKRERRIRFGPAQRPTQEAVWILLGGDQVG